MDVVPMKGDQIITDIHSNKNCNQSFDAALHGQYH